MTHPGLASVRMLLGTADAHGLYARFGFVPVNADAMMHRPVRRPTASE